MGLDLGWSLVVGVVLCRLGGLGVGNGPVGLAGLGVGGCGDEVVVLVAVEVLEVQDCGVPGSMRGENGVSGLGVGVLDAGALGVSKAGL